MLTCGRTVPLRYPYEPPDAGEDAGVDAGLDAGFDAGPTPCVPGVVTLTRARATVMFVLDRSGSMSFAFGGTTRWRALEEGLAGALPTVDQTMAIGAYVFPVAGASTCDAPLGADLAPVTGNVTPLLTLMNRSTPSGGTPTADALDRAATSLRSLRTAKSARALVLATDGAPGCNALLNAFTCTCTRTPGCGAQGPDNCLDDVRTLGRLQDITDGGLPTWVIGIQDGADPLFNDVLDRMAVAGGRPRNGTPLYYPATSPAQLEQALVEIRDQVGACTFLTASVPDALGNIRVFLDGQQVFEDPAHVEGWSWVDRRNGELVFSGQACARASQGAVVTANVGCSGP
jgi:hypothetical protein